MANLTWVSVTEKVPPNELDVLVYDSSGRMHRARRTYNGRRDIWAYHDQDCGLPVSVTHWTVLPRLPSWAGRVD